MRSSTATSSMQAGFMAGSSLSGIAPGAEHAAYHEDRARAHAGFAARRDEAVGECQACALLVQIDARLEPVTDLRAAGVVERQVGRDEAGGRISRERHGITHRHVGKRSEDAAMNRATGVAVLVCD